MADFNLLIPDASVLLKLAYSEEDGKENAFKFLNDFLGKKVKVLIPSLCLWELNNSLGLRCDANTATSLFSMFKSLSFREISLNLEISHLAFQIMKRAEKVSFYDASYHAIAIKSGGTFLTADNKYYEKTKSFGHIRLLSNY